MKKLHQFHILCCFTPKDPQTLSHHDIGMPLLPWRFSQSEKRSGEIKALGCADGSKKCQHIVKEKATTPTVSPDAIFIQGTIFAHECQDIATCDIPGTFLQADNPDYVLMHLDGILAGLMVTIAPSINQKYIMKMQKENQFSMFSWKRHSMGWWRVPSSSITIHRFWTKSIWSLCHYKMIDGEQMTICWHVDDLFLGHKNPDTVTNMIHWPPKRMKLQINLFELLAVSNMIILVWTLTSPFLAVFHLTYHASTKSSRNSLKRLWECHLHRPVITSQKPKMDL